jgi:hypothetical protein
MLSYRHEVSATFLGFERDTIGDLQLLQGIPVRTAPAEIVPLKPAEKAA